MVQIFERTFSNVTSSMPVPTPSSSELSAGVKVMPGGRHISRRNAIKTGAALAAVAAAPAFAQPAVSAPKVVLITGSSSGFGRLIAEGFAGSGRRVVATMRDVGERNAQAAADLGALASNGLPLDVVEIDVLSDESVTAGVARAAALAGRIDILVNNAGIAVPGPVELQPLSYFASNIDTNMGGALRMCRAVLPVMRAQGGWHHHPDVERARPRHRSDARRLLRVETGGGGGGRRTGLRSGGIKHRGHDRAARRRLSNQVPRERQALLASHDRPAGPTEPGGACCLSDAHRGDADGSGA
ncbi:hypothetical protein MES5069_60172 [Mesorhizobium escarrei]|uniref:SDR family NAD(P)-dependent oxidoreductase n=1 Tax=Mesorhizobium escarrei TaxID=666018 RepID=A0ABM9EFI2_9HYPH|nr:hypothetical protein MES5069_60172 [Mesorhizobium escarrei]